MDIKKEKIGDFSILKIIGRIDTLHSAELEIEVKKLYDSGETKVVLNCKEMNYISSSGLRVFLVAQKRAISTKGILNLCNLQPAIEEIFKISGFWNLFQIFDTQEQAINNSSV